MTLNMKKTIITDQRQYIQTLAYSCNFGMLTRPIEKLIAQLCYPEHGHVDKYISIRVNWFGYASCRYDYTFYLLCKDVCHTFLPYAAPLK